MFIHNDFPRYRESVLFCVYHLEPSASLTSLSRFRCIMLSTLRVREHDRIRHVPLETQEGLNPRVVGELEPYTPL